LTLPPRSPNLRFVNQLFFGDNLYVLRDHPAAESVDLIYLDPPFNSKNAGFKLRFAPTVCKVSRNE
jgi:16S rRNA G966 N2-methylase RsmD